MRPTDTFAATEDDAVAAEDLCVVPEIRNRWDLGSGVNQDRDAVLPRDRDDILDRRRFHRQRSGKPDQARCALGYG